MTPPPEDAIARHAAAVLALVRRAAAVEKRAPDEAVRALGEARRSMPELTSALDAASLIELVEGIAATLPETFAHPDAGAASLELQIACHEALGSRDPLPDLLVALAYLHCYRRRPEEAADAAAQAQALLGPTAAASSLAFHILRFLAAARRWNAAFHLAAAMRPPMAPAQRVHHLALRARAAAGLSLFEEAEASLRTAGDLMHRVPAGAPRAVASVALLKATAEIRLAAGEPERARAGALELVNLLETGSILLHEEERLDALAQACSDLVHIALSGGRNEEAEAWRCQRDRAEARLRACRGLHLRLVPNANPPHTPVP